MAQSMDAALLPPPAMDAESELLPQPMTAFPDKTPIGMAYVPYQMWGDVHNAEDGLAHGTMFPELDLPFCCGEGGMCK